ncbi:hypothetical protein SLEP1_g17166 [Rubroshorea leprosula]|uniref:Uncharacterized protein n=1 Tax=Rubroshorea leprosula TaxID=152421 RepID=A0AAV5IX40_9ROSI|nr:hypothetical protein SLEP1_g17166 [Rubroshorea leprosula]
MASSKLGSRTQWLVGSRTQQIWFFQAGFENPVAGGFSNQICWVLVREPNGENGTVLGQALVGEGAVGDEDGRARTDLEGDHWVELCMEFAENQFHLGGVSLRSHRKGPTMRMAKGPGGREWVGGIWSEKGG